MSAQSELHCNELVEIVTAYLEGAMSSSELVRFEGHIAACKGCRNYLEQMRHTIRAVGTLTEETIAPEARNTLLILFRNWKRSPAESR